jgi:ferredoxin-NADP reductase/MOSC domain-containing protein YiiM
MASVVSVNVALPETVTFGDKTVRTAIRKKPVEGRVMVRTLNIDGDDQADKAGHGGPNRAVMVYQTESYRYWEAFLGRPSMSPGQFGENLTIEGLPDVQVCIGDRYRIGRALFEVTQPRVTCFRLGLQMNHPQMPALLVAHHRPGFYMRVLEEGDIGAGDRIEKVADGPERYSVADIDALLYLPGHAAGDLARALRIPSLSPGWQDSFRAMLDAVRTPKPSRPKPLWAGMKPVTVLSVKDESDDVRSLVLGAQDGSPLPAPVPGQFVAIRIDRGEGIPPLLRSYSISAWFDGTYRLSVKRASGEGSQYLHLHASVGTTLCMSAPRGDFVLQDDPAPVVLLSAGIGQTPVLAMLRALALHGDPRPIYWIHGARSGCKHAFREEARSLLGQLPHARSLILFSQPADSDLPGVSYDLQGRINLSTIEQLGVDQTAHFYLCGPGPFTDELARALIDWGCEARHVHSEVFANQAPLVRSDQKAPHPPAGDPGGGPRVTFARSGLTVDWHERFPSLLALAEACDVPVQWSCRAGVCHLCQSGLLEGALAYDPTPLDMPPEGDVLLCCSVPTSAISLDL